MCVVAHNLLLPPPPPPPQMKILDLRHSAICNGLSLITFTCYSTVWPQLSSHQLFGYLYYSAMISQCIYGLVLHTLHTLLLHRTNLRQGFGLSGATCVKMVCIKSVNPSIEKCLPFCKPYLFRNICSLYSLWNHCYKFQLKVDILENHSFPRHQKCEVYKLLTAAITLNSVSFAKVERWLNSNLAMCNETDLWNLTDSNYLHIKYEQYMN